MPLSICGVSEVPAFSAAPLDHIISIKDRSQCGPNLAAFRSDFALHSFVFDDTGDAAAKHAVTESAIRRLLGVYAQTTLESRMLFHCFAGVSRSSAAAFLWLVWHGVSYDQAYQLIVSIRGPFVCPNQLMVSLADTIMGRGGEMAAFMSRETGRRAEEREQWFAAHR